MARRRGGRGGVPGGGGRRRGARISSPAGPGPGRGPGGPVRLGRRDAPARWAGQRPPRRFRARRGGGDGGVPRAPAGGVAGRSVAPFRPRAVGRLPSRDRPAAPADLQGRLFVHRARADLVAAPREPVRPDARRLPRRSFRGRSWDRSGSTTPSVYGPLFTHLAGLVTRTTPRLDMLVDAFRLIAIAASLATTFVIAAVSRGLRPDRAAFAVAAFGLNPVILFQSAGSGHNDLLVALGIAAGRLVRPPGADALGGRARRVRGSGQGDRVPSAAPTRRSGSPGGGRPENACAPGRPTPPSVSPWSSSSLSPSSNGMTPRSACLSCRHTRDGSRRPGSSAVSSTRSAGTHWASSRAWCSRWLSSPRSCGSSAGSRAPPRRGARCSSSSGAGGGRCSS